MFITPEDFKRAFEAAFIVNRGHLSWDTPPRRTAHMLAHIYRTIAGSFPKTHVEYEYNKIDAVLYSNDLENIEVAIEHENRVETIATELDNFAKYNFPLNVLITYTGNKDLWLTNKHGQKMDALCDRLLVILNPPQCGWYDREQHDPTQHDLILWEYWLWTKNGFKSV